MIYRIYDEKNGDETITQSIFLQTNCHTIQPDTNSYTCFVIPWLQLQSKLAGAAKRDASTPKFIRSRNYVGLLVTTAAVTHYRAAIKCQPAAAQSDPSFASLSK